VTYRELIGEGGTVLVVDDQDQNRLLLRDLLEANGLSVAEAADGESALESVRADQPDVILLDVNMPGIDGYEAARRIRAAYPDDWIPIIFLSANEYDQNLDRAIECGGDDYLVKPVSAVVLSAKMRALQRQDDMRRKLSDLSAELTTANRQLETLAGQDSLTGIANRRTFDFLMARHFAQAARQHSPLSVVLCDVDHFKAYNDHYGHPAGDACLRQIASALAQSCKRGGDFAARYGGEEFALILPDTPAEGAVHVIDVARQGVAALAIPHERSSTLKIVTFSAGIATFVEGSDTDAARLIERADQALYRAKELGRNRSVCA